MVPLSLCWGASCSWEWWTSSIEIDLIFTTVRPEIWLAIWPIFWMRTKGPGKRILFCPESFLHFWDLWMEKYCYHWPQNIDILMSQPFVAMRSFFIEYLRQMSFMWYSTQGECTGFYIKYRHLCHFRCFWLWFPSIIIITILKIDIKILN